VDALLGVAVAAMSTLPVVVSDEAPSTDMMTGLYTDHNLHRKNMYKI
jgi:hypothetical protein